MTTRNEARAVLAAHRALYDAVETGDRDLLESLWVDHPGTTCVHPGSPVLKGTADVLMGWTVLMAQIDYIQFFLTDVDVSIIANGAVAVVTCTESILSAEDGTPSADDQAFGAATAASTSVLVEREGVWRLWSRHASAVAVSTDEIEEP